MKSNYQIKKKSNTNNWLEDALDLDVYVGSTLPLVNEFTDYLFNDISKRAKINNKPRSKETLKLILLNLWVAHQLGIPIKYSRNPNNYAKSMRYGMLHFKYNRVITISDTLEEMGLIHQVKGFYDRGKDLKRQTRMYAADDLSKMFIDAMLDSFDVIEKLPPQEIIQLKDNDKKLIDYQETTETIEMRRKLSKYNQFIRNQSVCVSIHGDQLVNLQFLADLKPKLLKGAISINEVDLRYPKLRIVRNNSNSIDNSKTSSPKNSINSGSIKDSSKAGSTTINEDNDTRNHTYNYNNTNQQVDKTTSTSHIESDTIPTMTNKVFRLVNRMLDKDDHPEQIELREAGMNYLDCELNYELLHRVFNKRCFGYGGRFYGASHIGLRKEIRPHIRINGNSTTELDYSAYHIRMLYHLQGHPYKNDPYRVLCDKPEDRKMYKLVQLIAINADNEKKAVKAIRDEFRKKGIIYDLSDASIKKLLEKFYRTHKPINGYLNSGIGRTLQKIDSIITEEILVRLLEEGIPVLPIHDSYIVEHAYKDVLAELMVKAYENVIGFSPIIEVKT